MTKKKSIVMVNGYILEQFPRTKKQLAYFKVFRTKSLAQNEIIGLPKDGRPNIYSVAISYNSQTPLI